MATQYPYQVAVDGVMFDIDWSQRTTDCIVYAYLEGETRHGSDHLQFRLMREYMDSEHIACCIRRELGL